VAAIMLPGPPSGILICAPPGSDLKPWPEERPEAWRDQSDFTAARTQRPLIGL